MSQTGSIGRRYNSSPKPTEPKIVDNKKEVKDSRVVEGAPSLRVPAEWGNKLKEFQTKGGTESSGDDPWKKAQADKKEGQPSTTELRNPFK